MRVVKVYCLEPMWLPAMVLWSLGAWRIALGPKRYHGLLHRLRSREEGDTEAAGARVVVWKDRPPRPNCCTVAPGAEPIPACLTPSWPTQLTLRQRRTDGTHGYCLSGMMGWMMAGSAVVGLLFILLLVLVAALIKYLRSS